MVKQASAPKNTQVYSPVPLSPHSQTSRAVCTRCLPFLTSHTYSSTHFHLLPYQPATEIASLLIETGRPSPALLTCSSCRVGLFHFLETLCPCLWAPALLLSCLMAAPSWSSALPFLSPKCQGFSWFSPELSSLSTFQSPSIILSAQIETPH